MGDATPQIIEQRCRENIRLAYYEVATLQRRIGGRADQDDLTSAAMFALFLAARDYQPEHGVPFHRYAARRIKGALIDSLRQADWAPRSVTADMVRRDAEHNRLTAELGRTPTRDELAAAMGTTVADLERIEARWHARMVHSLDLAGHDATRSHLGNPEPEMLAREERAYLRDAIAALPERHRAVVHLVMDGKRYGAIGSELGVSESRVSQMLQEAGSLLRDGMNAHLAPEMVPEPSSTLAARRRRTYYAEIDAQSTYPERLTGKVRDTWPTPPPATPTPNSTRTGPSAKAASRRSDGGPQETGPAATPT